jgi:hypothetical protein
MFGQREALDEERFADPPDQARPVRDEIIERVVPRDHTEVDVREAIRLAPRVGAAEEGRHDPLVVLAGLDEAIEQGSDVSGRARVGHGRSLAGLPPAVEPVA